MLLLQLMTQTVSMKEESVNRNNTSEYSLDYDDTDTDSDNTYLTPKSQKLERDLMREWYRWNNRKSISWNLWNTNCASRWIIFVSSK